MANSPRAEKRCVHGVVGIGTPTYGVMTSRLPAYQCHTSFDEPCSSCNTVTVTLAIGQDLIIINKKVDYDEIFASHLGEIGSFRDLFIIRLIRDS